MASWPRTSALLLLAAAGLAALRADGPPDPWGALLAAAELEPATAQLSSARWSEGGAHRMPAFQRLWDDWRQVEGYARGRAHALRDAGPALAALFAAGAAPLESAVVVAPTDDAPPPGLAAALADLHAGLGAPLDVAARADLEARAAAVPAPVAEAAAGLLARVPQALAARERALAPALDPDLPAPEARAAAFASALRLATGYRVDEASLRLLERCDLDALLAGARSLAASMDRAVTALARADAAALGSFAFSWDTPLGRVTLQGDGSQRIGTEPMLLAIDTAGDDLYEAGAGATDAEHPISLLIDLDGDDRYQSAASGDFGVGLLGYGMLVDLHGDDRYSGQSLAQGCGVVGVGLLLDLEGDDRYALDEHGQGAATLGLGLLADLEGDDRYLCLQQSQGYGGARGAGVLLDTRGDDRYEADDQDIRRPSAQTKEHNVSLSQGCGFGRRAHPGDGRSLAGGEGLLVDLAGDDRYRCGVFGQGTAYWFALGLLVDLGGDDDYQGVWYVQGASAHYAVAGLLEAKGDDRYRLTHTQGQGHGHDYSLGLLRDLSGDDRYRGGSNALGVGLWNGIGVLHDGGGQDLYAPAGASLGFAGDARPEHLTLGLFLDEGGAAGFPSGEQARAGEAWVRPVAEGRPRARGLGAAR